jgi:Zn-dependent peptidase ImmA (M78 family)
MEKKTVEHNLLNFLLNFCLNKKIPIEYKKKISKEVGGRLNIYYDTTYNVSSINKIEIIEKFKNYPYILAHELGHYISITNKRNWSEESADAEANTLCCQFLSKDEQKLLGFPIENFQEKIVSEKHPLAILYNFFKIPYHIESERGNKVYLNNKEYNGFPYVPIDK